MIPYAKFNIANEFPFDLLIFFPPISNPSLYQS